MKKWFFLVFFLLWATITSAADYGIVIANINDEKFVISTPYGKHIFGAQSYCFNINEDDKVIFIENPSVCVSNTFVDLQTGSKCQVWCE
jgi:hypothetical protein